MIKRFFAVFLLLSAFASTTFPQQSQPTPTAPQGQDETIRVGTTAVQMDAIVTDKNGRRITGLTAADFQVLDEGAPQAVDFFTAVEGSRVSRTDNRAQPAAAGANAQRPATASASPLLNPFVGRHIALVFDDLSFAAENFLRARLALSEYVKSKLTPNDMAAIISTRGSLGSLQQFTNDKQRLQSAINRIAAQPQTRDRSPDDRIDITEQEARRIDAGDTFVLDRVSERNMATNPNEFEAEGLDHLKERVRSKARAIVSQTGLATRITLQTLSNLFRAMGDLPGRKIVVLMTESLSTGGGSLEDVSNQLVQLMELARRSGVSVYALDAAGIRTNSATASERITATGLFIKNSMGGSFSDFEALSAARTLAAGTGGEFIANTNDLGSALERAVDDSSTYYVLGFKPANLDNKFHRLTVTVKGKPDLVVRTRRGYLAINQETAAGTNAELIAALVSPVPRTDLPLELVANVVPKGGGQTVIAGLHIGRNYLTLPGADAADQTASYEVLAYVFPAGRDKPVDDAVQRTLVYDLKQAEARQRLKTEGLVLVKEFVTLPPGNYQMRAVVRERASGMLGSAYQFFEVPDVRNTKVTSVSSLLITPAGQTGFGGHNSFKRGSEMDVRYIIYNLPKDSKGIMQRVKLSDDQGRVLMDSELPLNPAAGVDQAQAPQGTRLSAPAARGRYALVVTLKDAKGKVDVERRADLVVE